MDIQKITVTKTDTGVLRYTQANTPVLPAEANVNAAHESVFQVLTKLGVSPDDLALTLGVEPKAVREKRQANEQAERDKMRKDWEAGQKFDAEEREKIKPTPAPAAGIKAKVTKLELSTMNVEYTNNNAVAATLKIRVGSTDRPDRIVAAGKTAVSTYTTTAKTGFTGQKLTVLHVEYNTLILEQVL